VTGVGTYIENFARGLTGLGHEVHVVVVPYGSVEQRDEVVDGVHEHWRNYTPTVWTRALYGGLGMRRASRWLRSSQLAMQTLETIKPDIVEVPSIFIGSSRRWPLVVHLHQAIELDWESEDTSAGLDRLAIVLARQTTRRAAVVFSPSDLLVTECLGRGWNFPRGVRVLPYPLDVEAWSTVKSPDRTDPVVLYVGRFAHLKGLDVVIDAMAELGDIEGCRLRIVGASTETRDGMAYVDWLTNRAAKRNVTMEVVAQKSTKEVVSSYAEARVIAQAARFDNFPMTILEAMSCSRPVVVSDHVGSAPLVREGDGGVVVPAENSASLAEALRPFLENPMLAAETGARARAAVVAHCAVLENAKRRVDIYEQAIQHSVSAA
jgi:glycosyltransferase involved in cell wall biosynthesis